MREWVTVLCVGGGGGGLAALFALWVRFERSLGTDEDKHLRSAGYWLSSLLINAFAGATVGFFLWATYTGANMSSVEAPPGVLAATLAVGVGGGAAVQRVMYVEGNLREVADESAISVKNVLEATLSQSGDVDADSGSRHTDLESIVEREGENRP